MVELNLLYIGSPSKGYCYSTFGDKMPATRSASQQYFPWPMFLLTLIHKWLAGGLVSDKHPILGQGWLASPTFAEEPLPSPVGVIGSSRLHPAASGLFDFDAISKGEALGPKFHHAVRLPTDGCRTSLIIHEL